MAWYVPVEPAPLMKILDCTFRDGGYYTNWDFDAALVDAYLDAMAILPVDAVELGYRSRPQSEYLGKFFYCPAYVLEKARAKLKGKKLAIMLNEKDCDASTIHTLIAPHAGSIDIVRFAVDPERIGSLPPMIDALHALGIEVAVNLMYLSQYVANPSGLVAAARVVESADCLNLVDSYGGVYPDQVRDLVRAVKSESPLVLGYHGHNNLELAFANALAALEAGCTWLDSTLTGMGRGAGNLKTELVLTHYSAKMSGEVDMDVLSGVVDEFAKLHEQHQWGTNLPYMVSGAASLPQKDVMDWVTKRSYSVNSMVRALENQRSGQRDNLKLPTFQAQSSATGPVLIIGGGPGAIDHAEGICKWIETNGVATVIHSSGKNAAAYAKVKAAQYFCLVGNEGKRIERVFGNAGLPDAGFILPPYPRKMGTYLTPWMQERSCELSHIGFSQLYADSHTAVAMQAAIDSGAQEIWIAGYDGYSGTFGIKEQDLFMENEHLFRSAANLGIRLFTLTPSKYSILIPVSPYASI